MQSAVPLRLFAHVREPSTLSAMSSHSNLGQKSDYAKYTGSYYANRIGGTTLLVARHVRPAATSCDPRQSLVMRDRDAAGAGQCRSSNATLSYRRPVEFYTLQYGDHGITSPDILCYVTRLPGLGPVCCTFNLTSLH